MRVAKTEEPGIIQRLIEQFVYIEPIYLNFRMTSLNSRWRRIQDNIAASRGLVPKFAA